MAKELLKFHYDAEKDIMEIEGIKYHGDLFRAWGQDELLPIDVPFVIKKRTDGVLHIEEVEIGGER